MDYTGLGIGTPTVSIGTCGEATTLNNIVPVFSAAANVYGEEITYAYQIQHDQPGAQSVLTGRRPAYGQLYPRGVYGK